MRVMVLGAGGFIGGRIVSSLLAAGHTVICAGRDVASLRRRFPRCVVLADWLFTAPSVIVQPVTGAWMAHLAGIPLGTAWLSFALGLYVFVGACWLPVVWLQIRMHRLADTARHLGQPLPAIYFVYARVWFALGWPAFAGVLAIFYLMLFKPELAFWELP